MDIALFFIVIFGSFIFTSIFGRLVPGGNEDLKIVLGIAVFITGEIAVCTNLILKKLDKINKLKNE